MTELLDIDKAGSCSSLPLTSNLEFKREYSCNANFVALGFDKNMEALLRIDMLSITYYNRLKFCSCVFQASAIAVCSSAIACYPKYWIWL